MTTATATAPLPVLRSNVAGIIPGLAERGKIKIGEKGKMVTSQQGNKFQPPKKLDHFRVTTLEKDEADNFLTDAAIHKILGAEPKEIPIMLMFDEIGRNFSTRYVCYRGKTRWCSGDGENALRITDDKENISSVPCPCERLAQDYKGQTRCKIAGVLSMVIRGAETVGGVWKLRTTSWNSCQSITSSLALIQQITSGRLAGLPLMLTLSPKTGTTPEGKTQTIYVVSIEYRGTPESLMEAGYQKMLQNATYTRRMELVAAEADRLIMKELPAAEDADFVDEFVPEQAQSAMEDEAQAEPPAAAAQTAPPKQTKPRAAKPAAIPAPEQTETEPAVPPSGAEAFGLTGEDTAGPDDGPTPEDEPGDNEQSGDNEDDDFNDPF